MLGSLFCSGACRKVQVLAGGNLLTTANSMTASSTLCRLHY